MFYLNNDNARLCFTFLEDSIYCFQNHAKFSFKDLNTINYYLACILSNGYMQSLEIIVFYFMLNDLYISLYFVGPLIVC